jgi:hypothetical protein
MAIERVIGKEMRYIRALPQGCVITMLFRDPTTTILITKMVGFKPARVKSKAIYLKLKYMQ